MRAKFLLNPRAPFALARQFQAEGLPLATVFAFASGLYFRGKIAYSRRFAPPESGDVVRVITSNAGLVDPEKIIGPPELIAFGTTQIEAGDETYHGPLRRHARALRRKLGATTRVILLGSIATPKYREVLLEVFGPHLLFPSEFVGRGDMSRGALLLRAARAGTELEYVPVEGAILTGRRARRVDHM
ncbi:MAG: hypothetical protein JWM32_2779 [Verrucomicrobia bacterium]|nr:hypothetical protein [Verrucomicrobiota bacterium]